MDAGSRVPPPELRFDGPTRRDGVTFLTVTGDIDLTTGDRFTRTLTRTLDEPGVTHLLLDLGPLRFIDSNGATAIIRAHWAADQRGIDFAVINACGPVRSVLKMLGVYEMLTTVGDPGPG